MFGLKTGMAVAPAGVAGQQVNQSGLGGTTVEALQISSAQAGLHPSSWAIAPLALPHLTPDDVHIWRIALAQNEAVLQKMCAALSADERQRAAQFKFEKLQKRFIISRGALRDILRRYTGRAAAEMVFEYEAHGKPQLAPTFNQNGIQFNLSHAENLALCGVTRRRAIGIDVEFIRSLDDAERLAQRFFSAHENARFSVLPPAQKTAAFYNCWTRKEAFIKALGEGLTHPLHRFDVAFVDGEPPALLHTRPDPREAARWTLQALAPAENYTGAFVVSGKAVKVKGWQWDAPLR